MATGVKAPGSTTITLRRRRGQIGSINVNNFKCAAKTRRSTAQHAILAFAVFFLAANSGTAAEKTDSCSKSRAAARKYYPDYEQEENRERVGTYTFRSAIGETLWLSCPNENRASRELKVWWEYGKPPAGFAARAGTLAAQVFDLPAKPTIEMTNDCLASAKSKGLDIHQTADFVLICSYNDRHQITLLYDERP